MGNQKNTTGNREQLVTFLLGKEIYGIDIFKVREVIHFTKITTIPNAPEFVEGITRVRDQVIPIVNMKKRLGIVDTKTENNRIIILELESQPLGIIVDDVSHVLMLDADDYEPLPEAVINGNKDCISRLFKQEENLIIVISPELILNKDDKQSLKKLEQMPKGK